MSKSWRTPLKGQKFIASYSGGKDSTLALYAALQTGEALGLIIMRQFSLQAPTGKIMKLNF